MVLGLTARRRPSEHTARRPTPVLIGHSHATAIFMAAEQAGMKLEGFNFWTAPQPFLNAEATAFHPEISRTLARGPVFSVVGGAAHQVLTMIGYSRPIDFVLPAEPDLPLHPAAEILPYGAVRAAMAEAMAEYLKIIALVRADASERVYHIEAPPPLEDGERIHADVPWSFFADRPREVAPAPLRYKAWRLHSELVQGFCNRLGVEVIEAPRAAMDACGYLRPAYYKDAMHVGANYGALVLEQMKAVL